MRPNTTHKKAVPVCANTNGDRCNPSIRNEQKGSTIMTQSSDTDQDGRFSGDRYERLVQAAEVIASDPGIENADSLFNGEFLRTFIRELVNARVLDGLTERDCNTFAMLVVLDTRLGPSRLAWRIHRWLEGDHLDRNTDSDNPFAVCSALASALKIMLDGFVEAFAAQDAKS